MNIKNLLELGKMGYTKKEITELLKADKNMADEPDAGNTNDKLLNDIADLKQTVASLQAIVAKGTSSGNDSPDTPDNNIDDILLKLAGGESGADGDTK